MLVHIQYSVSKYTTFFSFELYFILHVCVFEKLSVGYGWEGARKLYNVYVYCILTLMIRILKFEADMQSDLQFKKLYSASLIFFNRSYISERREPGTVCPVLQCYAIVDSSKKSKWTKSEVMTALNIDFRGSVLI